MLITNVFYWRLRAGSKFAFANQSGSDVSVCREQRAVGDVDIFLRRVALSFGALNGLAHERIAVGEFSYGEAAGFVAREAHIFFPPEKLFFQGVEGLDGRVDLLDRFFYARVGFLVIAEYTFLDGENLVAEVDKTDVFLFLGSQFAFVSKGGACAFGEYTDEGDKELRADYKHLIIPMRHIDDAFVV